MHNYELAFSKNSMQAKQKLHNSTDPALAVLTAKPEMVYESKRVKIKAPIAAAANLGSYTVDVSGTPMHMSGTIKPPPINGELTMGKRRFKYSADIEFKVDVVLHQKPKGPELVEVLEQSMQKKKDFVDPNTSTKWDQTVAEKGVVVAVVSLVLYAGYRAAELFISRGLRHVTIPPFIHEIDHHNRRREA